MGRVHDALRRAGIIDPLASGAAQSLSSLATSLPIWDAAATSRELLQLVKSVPNRVSSDALIFDPLLPGEPSIEEFRALRTRLNHMQSQQPIHTVVIASASPAEGKSFTATNLALAEAQVSGNLTLLCDFDLRRPVINKLFEIEGGPGVTDYLQNKVSLEAALRRVGETNLYIMPAGQPVNNPLELLNLDAARQMLQRLPSIFNWIIIDTPPLLFAADGNLLATLSDGTILVVRIGATAADSVARVMQSLCRNNLIGVVVNGARRGELYNKYTSYYHSYRPASENQNASTSESGVL